MSFIIEITVLLKTFGYVLNKFENCVHTALIGYLNFFLKIFEEVICDVHFESVDTIFLAELSF